MAKYIINEGYESEMVVEDADTVRQIESYFYFSDRTKTTVYIRSAAMVHTIKRTD